MANIVSSLPTLLVGIPAGTWVAISEEQERVISFGADAQAVLDEAREKGENVPLIVKVPEHNFLMVV